MGQEGEKGATSGKRGREGQNGAKYYFFYLFFLGGSIEPRFLVAQPPKPDLLYKYEHIFDGICRLFMQMY
jgi:hypothetical protein